MRLFVAIELPEQVKAGLAALRREIPGARWLAAGQLHLTLAFVGEVPQEQSELFCSALSGIRQAPFELHFDRTGCFPHQYNPRVLWIGFRPQPALVTLVGSIREAVAACGLVLEERPFNAHITLARLKQPELRTVANWLAKPLNHELPNLQVREFVVFQSRLSPQGAQHTPLRRFALR